MRYSSKPVGWRGESHRHYLAAKGIKTRYDAKKPAKKPSEYERFRKLHEDLAAGKSYEELGIRDYVGEVRREEIEKLRAERIANVKKALGTHEESPERGGIKRLRQSPSLGERGGFEKDVLKIAEKLSEDDIVFEEISHQDVLEAYVAALIRRGDDSKAKVVFKIGPYMFEESHSATDEEAEESPEGYYTDFIVTDTVTGDVKQYRHGE